MSKLTPEASKFISKHIEMHMREGMIRPQAIAAAYSEARRAGFDVSKAPKRKRFGGD